MEKTKIQVTITTSLGDIQLELNNEKAPITVENFIKIAQSGFYEGTIFHRVIKGFMIQGGAMISGLREKDSGTNPIQNEADNGLSNDRGTIAMARTMEPHSAKSQFFINLNDNLILNHRAKSMDGWGYAVFGVVTKGMDVVDAIAEVPTSSSGMHLDVPREDVTIESVTISE